MIIYIILSLMRNHLYWEYWISTFLSFKILKKGYKYKLFEFKQFINPLNLLKKTKLDIIFMFL